MEYLTEKRLKNKKFRKTEEVISEIVFSSKSILSARVIIKRAKISRATFYRHHKTVYSIIPDYEEYILNKYNKLMQGIIAKDNIKIKTIYYQMLIFIILNRKVLKGILGKENNRILEKMVEKIEPRIIKDYKLPKNSHMMIKVYQKEVVAVIENWIKTNLKDSEMVILNDIMYLTDTMRTRLKGLLK